MKYLFIFFLSCAFSFPAFTQNEEIDSLKAELKKNIPDTVRVSTITSLAWKLRLDHPDTALICLKDGLALAEKINYKKGTGKIHFSFASVFFNRGDFPTALEHHFKSLVLWDELEKEKKYSHHELADLRARSFSNIALVYNESADHKNSLKYHFKALPLEEEGKDSLGLASTLGNIGLVYSEMKKFPEALEYNLKALKIKEALGNKKGISITLGNIGLVYADQKDFRKALEYFLKALKLAEETKSKRLITIWAGNIGSLHTKEKRYKEAEEYLLRSLAVAEEIGSQLDIQQQYGNLSELYIAKGDYKKGYEYYKQFSELKDSIFNGTKSEQITEMQTKYETEKKERENKLLSSENKLNVLEINRQKSQRNFIIILFCLILLSAGMLFNRNRLKNKNKILEEKDLRNKAVFRAQEDEKSRLSQELHDGVGPLLSLIKLNISSLEKNAANEKMIHEIKELSSEAMKEVRNISHTLMPSLLDKKGLEPALREFVEQINQTNTLKAGLHYSVTSKLPADTEINIYRIIQEALNNVLKHSDSSIGTVSLREENNLVELSITDNGKGFDVNKIPNGNGLNNMLSRVDLVKAKLRIDSSPGKGTALHINIPIPSSHV